MTDVFEAEGQAEPTISIGDYLKVVEEEDLKTGMVLGGDEGKECTYNKGYMKRQASFSCLTCTPKGNAGVCTACSSAPCPAMMAIRKECLLRHLSLGKSCDPEKRRKEKTSYR